MSGEGHDDSSNLRAVPEAAGKLGESQIPFTRHPRLMDFERGEPGREIRLPAEREPAELADAAASKLIVAEKSCRNRLPSCLDLFLLMDYLTVALWYRFSGRTTDS